MERPQLDPLVGTPLQAKPDYYSGVLIESEKLPTNPEQFRNELQESLEKWRDSKRKGVWLKIPIQKSNFIPISVEFGFSFHHAQADYVMMTLWLPSNQPSTLPNYATSYVGVGGFVLNDKNEVLVIQEKHGPIKGFWKIPGGMVEPNEELCDAAVREVLEETGIQCEFVSLLCFRQAHTYSFGLSDMYFVCRLKPLTLDIKMQESEIQDAKWMPAEEFFALSFYKGLYRKILEIERENANSGYQGFRVEHLPIGFRPGNNNLYHAAKM